MNNLNDGQENDELNTLSMNILIHSGNARELVVSALNDVENKEFSEAKQKIKNAHSEIVEAHGMQTDTLQLEASGKTIRYSTLFCHAQDTLMTAQSELLIAEHLVKILEKYEEN